MGECEAFSNSFWLDHSTHIRGEWETKWEKNALIILLVALCPVLRNKDFILQTLGNHR